ncbi:MAG: DNA-3-methyladenine glycosylase [Cellulomonadaceae bacterium]
MTRGLERVWFERPVLDVARDLLGATLVSRAPGGEVRLRITEVEAYDGERDPGSHAFRGRSRRNASMFGPGGQLYVYRHLGLHTCANVVCAVPGTASAVLLRAGEVTSGTELATARRSAAGKVSRPAELASGPARLTVALGITPADDGAGLLDPDGRFLLVPGSGLKAGAGAAAAIERGPRVGVGGPGGEGELFPWRLWLSGDDTVSRYRPAVPRRSRTGQTRAAPTPTEEQQ